MYMVKNSQMNKVQTISV